VDVILYKIYVNMTFKDLVAAS